MSQARQATEFKLEVPAPRHAVSHKSGLTLAPTKDGLWRAHYDKMTEDHYEITTPLLPAEIEITDPPSQIKTQRSW